MSEISQEKLDLARELEIDFLKYEQHGLDFARELSVKLELLGLKPAAVNRLKRRAAAANEANKSVHELLERGAKSLGIPLTTESTTSGEGEQTLATDKDDS